MRGRLPGWCSPPRRPSWISRPIKTMTTGTVTTITRRAPCREIPPVQLLWGVSLFGLTQLVLARFSFSASGAGRKAGRSRYGRGRRGRDGRGGGDRDGARARGRRWHGGRGGDRGDAGCRHGRRGNHTAGHPLARITCG